MITQEQLMSGLSEIGAVVSPSELHGHLCGRLVVGHQISGFFGQKVTAECLGMSLEELDPIHEMLTELIEETAAILDADLFSFRLLLPDDEIALFTRLEALSNWCQGFLSGIASSAGLQDSKVMDEEGDTISDLVEISQISLDVDDSEENEALFLEVSEYVRLAAFNLFDQFRLQDGEAVSTGADTSIH